MSNTYESIMGGLNEAIEFDNSGKGDHSILSHSEYRYKLEIELDENMIIKDNKYEIQALRQRIIERFADLGIVEMVEIGRTMKFVNNDYDYDYYARFGRIATELYYKQKWFRRYAIKMLWYNNANGENHCENMLAAFRTYDLKFYHSESI